MITATARLLVKQGLPLLTRSAENPYAATGLWLFGTGGLVVGMISVGGITRLTQSGLSMTSWSPLGSLPPLTHAEWTAEFERYKTFPEWQQRQSMTLQDFQFIYAWEYGHRMMGRFIGIAFCLPWMYFTVRRKIPPGFQGRMVGLLAMGGTQGLVGWWMVKSGLGDDRRGDTKEIRVRPVRLATHLGMALATYGALLWTGLDVLTLPHSQVMTQQVQSLGNKALRSVSRLRIGSIALTGLTFATALSGGLVAGNDAGRAYNTWPKMDWPPNELWELSPWQDNLVATTATVQFNHRLLAQGTGMLAIGLSCFGLLRSPFLTPQARNGLYAIGLSASAQYALGVTTLIQYVPLSLAVAHQLGSVVVFTSGIYLTHALRYGSSAIVREAAPKLAQSTMIHGAAPKLAQSAILTASKIK